MEFTAEGLTPACRASGAGRSYAALELLMRYLRTVEWNRQLRRHLSAVVSGRDFGVVSLCRVILGWLVVIWCILNGDRDPRLPRLTGHRLSEIRKPRWKHVIRELVGVKDLAMG